jgi:hypothetical protein
MVPIKSLSRELALEFVCRAGDDLLARFVVA